MTIFFLKGDSLKVVFTRSIKEFVMWFILAQLPLQFACQTSYQTQKIHISAIETLDTALYGDSGVTINELQPLWQYILGWELVVGVTLFGIILLSKYNNTRK